MNLLERIETIAEHDAILIDIEWGRRIIYFIDCSKRDMEIHIPVVHTLHRTGARFADTLERSIDDIMAWLDANRTTYMAALAADNDEPLHALREAAITCK